MYSLTFRVAFALRSRCVAIAT